MPSRMTLRTLCLDIADWWWRTRNDPYFQDMVTGLFAIAAGLVFVVIVAGNVTNEERQQFDAPAPSGASVPASPPPPGLQAGTPSQQEDTP